MSQILIDPYRSVQIPLEGTVGAGRVERLFCPYAREVFLHPEDYLDQRGRLQPSCRCDHLHITVPTQDLIAWRCGLTGDSHLCLFDELHDPQWAIIANSVLLEAEEQAQPA